MNECKHGLKWEHCPFDNLGCDICKSNDLIPLSAKGYLDEAKKEHKKGNIDMMDFMYREGINHIKGQLYATERAYRKERAKNLATEDKPSDMIRGIAIVSEINNTGMEESVGKVWGAVADHMAKMPKEVVIGFFPLCAIDAARISRLELKKNSDGTVTPLVERSNTNGCENS